MTQETKCKTCIHRMDFDYDCSPHEPESVERGGVWIVLSCEGHTPINVEPVEPPKCHEDYLKRRRRLEAAGLMIGRNPAGRRTMRLSVEGKWEPIDLDKAERHLLPVEREKAT